MSGRSGSGDEFSRRKIFGSIVALGGGYSLLDMRGDGEINGTPFRSIADFLDGGDTEDTVVAGFNGKYAINSNPISEQEENDPVTNETSGNSTDGNNTYTEDPIDNGSDHINNGTDPIDNGTDDPVDDGGQYPIDNGTDDGGIEDDPVDNGTDEDPIDNGTDEDPIDNGTDDPIDNGTDDPIDNGTDNPVDNGTDPGDGDEPVDDPEYPVDLGAACDRLYIQGEGDSVQGNSAGTVIGLDLAEQEYRIFSVENFPYNEELTGLYDELDDIRDLENLPADLGDAIRTTRAEVFDYATEAYDDMADEEEWDTIFDENEEENCEF